MIPKIIHYCWFGNSSIPPAHQQYMQSWKSFLPDYQILLWNEKNSPMHLDYMQQAFNHKKWANLSNYTRLHALYEYGGIYLDTDIEILKSFESLLMNKCFLGFEDVHIDWDGCVNNAVMGAIPKHPFINELKDRLLVEFDGTEKAHLSSPNFITKVLKEKGLNSYSKQVLNSDIHLYPIEYFYPYSWHQHFTKACIKAETICIHHFERSWDEDDRRENFSKKILKLLKNNFNKIIKRFS